MKKRKGIKRLKALLPLLTLGILFTAWKHLPTPAKKPVTTEAYEKTKQQVEEIFQRTEQKERRTVPTTEPSGEFSNLGMEVEASVLTDGVLELTVRTSGEEQIVQIPAYSGEPAVVVNQNTPFFREPNPSEAVEYYPELDALGRCQSTFSYVTKSLMPTEERESIGMVKPSGWKTVRYDDLIEKKFLYQRCHLIAFCLTGENANPRNLITGTGYMNVDGMLPYEIEAADYLDHHPDSGVLYRSTPIFVGEELVARGVLMEARSDDDSVSFCVFCYNVQPGILINYKTGDSFRASSVGIRLGGMEYEPDSRL